MVAGLSWADLSISGNADLLRFVFHTTSKRFTESKKQILSEWNLSGRKCPTDIRYQISDARLLPDDKNSYSNNLLLQPRYTEEQSTSDLEADGVQQ